MKLELLAEQVIFAVGLLAVEGKVLPMNALRDGLATTTMVEGYALPDHELDILTVAVAHCAMESGLIGLNDGCLFFKVPFVDTVNADNLN